MEKPLFRWPVLGLLLPCAWAAVHAPVQARPVESRTHLTTEGAAPAAILFAGDDSRLFLPGCGRPMGTRRDRSTMDAPPADPAALLSYLKSQPFAREIADLHRALGIQATYPRLRGLPLQPEARTLVPVGLDIYQREQSLLPPAAAAWQAMAAAAAADGIELQLVSAFRPVDDQAGILRRKLEQGQSIDAILRVSAAPGYSEHHSGRAVDLTTPGYAVLEEEFEHSAAFAWLGRRAAEFGFRLSYPRGNPHGIDYEPWHWNWRGTVSGPYAAVASP